ncbi:TonB-dependent receptor [Bacteroidia bacterium]|nr:TonB-dependent receptor [Bacteroidia bacterium]
MNTRGGFFCGLICKSVSFVFAQNTATDTTSVGQALDEVVVTASLKQPAKLATQPVSFTSFYLSDIEKERISDPKSLSFLTPNLYMPDYGAKMTGSIYVRGIGARMEQPAMGLYVDNVPVLNKNNFDFDFYDIQRMTVLRGPQGTLYGRNAIGGVINIQTLSPFTYNGSRISASYGSGEDMSIALSTYQRPSTDFGYSLALRHHQSGGFYVNQFDGKKCDRLLSDGLRLRLQGKLTERWTIDNTLSINFVEQGGFAYAQLVEKQGEEIGETLPIDHNDPCTYRRTGLSEGLTLLYRGENIQFSSATSWQYTDDKMVMDQDFTRKSMFTLEQAQKEHAFTQEFILKSKPSENRWDWLCGVFGFYKNVNMDAPVTFKKDGIKELILDHANAGIDKGFPPADYPTADLLFEEDEFVIQSLFKLPVFGASAFHQSSLHLDSWKLTAGLRFDYEHTAIRYHNYADIHYRFYTMPQFKPIHTELQDKNQEVFYELTPHFSILYDASVGSIYATITRGYKTGGYNTQIFSDILQNQMMSDLLDALGVHLDNSGSSYDPNAAIAYKPECNWNYEIGSHLHFFENKLFVNAAIFYIDCYDQQLTVFPSGKTTGRMMSNAGRTNSYGAEIEASYTYQDLRLLGSYGHTTARFRTYSDGNEDFAGKYVPYAPQNTAYLCGEYQLNLKKSSVLNSLTNHILLRVDWRGIGRIYWNESNTLSQPFYGSLGGSIGWKREQFLVRLWGSNLTDAIHNVFYFKSIGNSFVQRGKPVQVGVSVHIDI